MHAELHATLVLHTPPRLGSTVYQRLQAKHVNSDSQCKAELFQVLHARSALWGLRELVSGLNRELLRREKQPSWCERAGELVCRQTSEMRVSACR